MEKNARIQNESNCRSNIYKDSRSILEGKNSDKKGKSILEGKNSDKKGKSILEGKNSDKKGKNTLEGKNFGINKKIGLMGGTFNPVHLGHLLLAEMAKSQVGLDEIWFLPSKNPPHKMNQKILSEKTRVRLLELSIEDNPDFSVCDMELKRRGITYTFETLTLLKEAYPDYEFYFIIGADSLFEFDTWRNPDIILKYAVLLAGSRDLAGKNKMEEKISSLKSKYGTCRIELIFIPEFLVSSQEIRKRIKEKKSIRYMVPENVREYIYENGLYIE